MGETLRSLEEVTGMVGPDLTIGQDSDSITAPKIRLKLDHWAREIEKNRHNIRRTLSNHNFYSQPQADYMFIFVCKCSTSLI